MFPLIKKKKNISVTIDASNSTSDIYFGDFVEAEDIPQIYAKLFFTNSNTGLFKIVLHFTYY